jgi:hypothetical protein
MMYKDKLPLVGVPVQIGFAVSAAGKRAIYQARLKGSVRLGDVKLDQPEIRFMEGGRPNIGLPILRTLTVVFDLAESRDWICRQKSQSHRVWNCFVHEVLIFASPGED